MRLTKIIFALAFMLLATTGFAAKKEKDVICHVGNEVGPNGEVYLDDPGCIPTEENGYFCPDAGKIDLIEVSKAAKHLSNPSHAYDGLADYLPGDLGASGVGNEDSEGDGIDDGCRPPVPPPASCPCWPAGVSDATAAVDIVDNARGPLTCVEATGYNADDNIVHIVSFYSPGCDTSSCNALAFSAFNVPGLPPNICGQNDAVDGLIPTMQIQNMSDQEFDACLAVLAELAEQESCD